MSDNQNGSIWARIFLYFILIDLILIVVAISGRMLLDWQPLSAFYPFFYGAQLGLALALIGLLQMLLGLFKKQKTHLKIGAMTLFLALLPFLSSLLVVGISGFKAPMIHDITTDMDDPPDFTMISSLRSPEENSLEYAGESIAAEQRKAFPEIQALISEMSPLDAHAQALKTMDTLGWVVIFSDESSGNIEAYDKSTVFGFIDDVVVRIRPAAQGSLIDMRSVSRVGEGDLGANARRIRHFFQVFAG